MNINSITFGGRLAADPEIRDVGDTKVARFRIISNRVFYKGKAGEKEKCEEITSMDAEVWGGRAKVAEYFSKGDGIVVEGHLKEDNWEDKDGNKRYGKRISVREVHFGEKKGAGNGNSKPANETEEKKPEPAPEQQQENNVTEPDDQVPF